MFSQVRRKGRKAMIVITLKVKSLKRNIANADTRDEEKALLNRELDSLVN
jgi:hypothetical protein